jgi:hypothetical protein
MRSKNQRKNNKQKTDEMRESENDSTLLNGYIAALSFSIPCGK